MVWIVSAASPLTTEARGVDVEGTYYLIRLVSMLTHIIDGVHLWGRSS